MTNRTAPGGEAAHSAQIHLQILNQERFLPFAKAGEFIGSVVAGVGLLVESVPTTMAGVLVAGASAGMHIATRLEIADLSAEISPTAQTQNTAQQSATTN